MSMYRFFSTSLHVAGFEGKKLSVVHFAYSQNKFLWGEKWYITFDSVFKKNK